MFLFLFFSIALREDRLALVQNGSSSPCLDLRYNAFCPYVYFHLLE